MDMDEIKTFVAIARLGSFSRAAESLHRSQPAISRRVELLERELDVSLFERLHKGALLTDAGAALLPYAESVLASAKDGISALHALKRGESGRISIALVGTLADSRFTKLLRGFNTRHPQVRLDVRTATSKEVAELVLRGDATLGLRYLVESKPELIWQTVTREKMVVVCGAGHRLADSRRHGIRELAGERWVAFPVRRPLESFAQFLQRKLFAAGITDPEIVPIDSLSAQKRLVEAGFGVALLARSGVHEELRLGTLKTVNVPPLRASIPVTLVYRRNGYLSPAAKNLLSAMVRARGYI